MHIPILAILLLFSSALFAQHTNVNTEDLADFKTEKYTVLYPRDWVLDSTHTYGPYIFFISHQADSLDLFRENMNIFEQDLSGQNYTLLKMGQESERDIRNMVTDVQVLESRIDSAVSPVRYIVRYKGRQGKFMLTTIQHYYFVNETGYALTMTIQEGKEQEYLPAADKIFNSFRLLK